MTHRMILKPESRLRKITATDILDDIIDNVSVPVLDQEARV